MDVVTHSLIHYYSIKAQLMIVIPAKAGIHIVGENGFGIECGMTVLQKSL
jgi:hypothetical protein